MSIRLENVRLSYPSLFKKTAFDEKATPKYSVMLIVPKNHPQLPNLKAEMKRVMQAKWSERPVNLKLALRDGKEKEGDGFGPDVVFFNASGEKRPGVYDRDRSPLTADDGRPYAGCYVNAVISPWAQDNQYGKRINFELNGVQFYADGEAFGGGAPPSQADDFPELDAAPEGAQAEVVDEWDDDDAMGF